jgi:hypothetical protein
MSRINQSFHNFQEPFLPMTRFDSELPKSSQVDFDEFLQFMKCLAVPCFVLVSR